MNMMTKQQAVEVLEKWADVEESRCNHRAGANKCRVCIERRQAIAALRDEAVEDEPAGRVSIRGGYVHLEADVAMLTRARKAGHGAYLYTRPAPQPEGKPCTCPSGDGSLRWPCPQHPPQPEGGVTEAMRALRARGDAALRDEAGEGEPVALESGDIAFLERVIKTWRAVAQPDPEVADAEPDHGIIFAADDLERALQVIREKTRPAPQPEAEPVRVVLTGDSYPKTDILAAIAAVDARTVAAAPQPESDKAIAALRHIAIRLCFLNMPGESMWNAGTEGAPRWVPDWRYTIALIENALHGTPITVPERPTDTKKRIEIEQPATKDKP